MWLHLLGSCAAGSLPPPLPPSETIFDELLMVFFFPYLVKCDLSPTLSLLPRGSLGGQGTHIQTHICQDLGRFLGLTTCHPIVLVISIALLCSGLVRLWAAHG